MPNEIKKTARKILEDKEEKGLFGKAMDYLKSEDKPSLPTNEARSPFEAEDVLSAIPAAGSVSKGLKLVRGAERVAGAAERVAPIARRVLQQRALGKVLPDLNKISPVAKVSKFVKPESIEKLKKLGIKVMKE